MSEIKLYTNLLRSGYIGFSFFAEEAYNETEKIYTVLTLISISCNTFTADVK